LENARDVISVDGDAVGQRRGVNGEILIQQQFRPPKVMVGPSKAASKVIVSPGPTSAMA